MTRSAGSNTVYFAVFGTLGYVREQTEFEGLLPRLTPGSNLKFCMFSITEFTDFNTALKILYTHCF